LSGTLQVLRAMNLFAFFHLYCNNNCFYVHCLDGESEAQGFELCLTDTRDGLQGSI
jgi:hypothetical protein